MFDVRGILDNLDVADIVDKFDIVFNKMILSTILTILGYFDILGIVDHQWMSWSLWTISNETFCSHLPDG